ncbi:ferritin-like domain-containing protein [Hymenobacter sp.]|jgi:hypothetical protein|uniref:ferritin-like domain-containing protein n=1 Tax=Hymenobacter sp. TaxID=1898978 RepID=UPI002EDA345A
MNLFNIISELEKVDPEVMDRLTHRRSAMTLLGDISKKMALAAAPIAIGSAFNKAVGQQTLADPNAVLNYALLLERLEYDFYRQALAAPTLTATLTGADRTAITVIRDHELAHVNLLTAVLGSNAAAAPANGFNFGNAFATYASFLGTAQALEDTGVRAYKGQATNIPRAAVVTGTQTNILQTALQIHSVEARHAAHVRLMRRGATAGAQTTIMPWIVNGDANGVPAVVYGAGNPATGMPPALFFPAEGNLVQAGVTLTTGLGAMYTAEDVSAAFDEGLDNTTVVAIARATATF